MKRIQQLNMLAGRWLFRFPADRKRRLLWARVCQRGDWTPTETSRLCSLHFTEDQFEQYRRDGWLKLKMNAVPTICGGAGKTLRVHDVVAGKNETYLLCDHDYVTLPGETNLEITSTYYSDVPENTINATTIAQTDSNFSGINCAVSNCTNNCLDSVRDNLNVNFYKFPKDEELRRRWIGACGRKGTWNFVTSHVCSLHFAEDDFHKTANSGDSNVKKKLKKNAVPSLHLSNVKTETEETEICLEPYEEELIIRFESDGHSNCEQVILQRNDENNPLESQLKKLQQKHVQLKSKYNNLEKLHKQQTQVVENLNAEMSQIKRQLEEERKDRKQLEEILKFLEQR